MPYQRTLTVKATPQWNQGRRRHHTNETLSATSRPYASPSRALPSLPSAAWVLTRTRKTPSSTARTTSEASGWCRVRCVRPSPTSWMPPPQSPEQRPPSSPGARYACCSGGVSPVRLRLLLGPGPLPLVPLGLTSLPLLAAPPLSPTRARGSGVGCHVIHPRNQVDERHPPAAVSRVHRGWYAAPSIGVHGLHPRADTGSAERPMTWGGAAPYRRTHDGNPLPPPPPRRPGSAARGATTRRPRRRCHEGLRQRRHAGARPRPRVSRRPERGVHRDHGPVGLGQVDAAALPRRARRRSTTVRSSSATSTSVR